MLIELLSSLWFKNPSIGHMIKGYWLILEHFLGLAFKIFFFFVVFVFFLCFLLVVLLFVFFFCFLLFFCCFLLFLFLAGKVSKVKDLTEQILLRPNAHDNILHDFSITQILCEINFGNFRGAKSAIS